MKTLRLHLTGFIALLLLSGITAFPLRTEMDFLMKHKSSLPGILDQWITEVFRAMAQTPDLVLYGTDWLAFAHIVIALFFIPVYLHPKQYKANMLVGMAACLLVFPLAFICGPIRGIPFFHQLIDCSFGLFGFIYLRFIYKKINLLETEI